MNYATLYQVRSYYLGLADDQTVDDKRLALFLTESSNHIRTHYRRCDPFQETRMLNYPAYAREPFGQFSLAGWIDQINESSLLGRNQLKMPDDLLELVSVTNGNGQAISNDDVILLPEGSLYPKHSLQLQPSSGLIWEPSSKGNTRQVIPVNGIWGWHDRYNETAWTDTLDAIADNPLTIGATEINVTDADGVDELLESPRYQAGHLIKAESEFMLIVAVDYDNNKLTVKRGAQGTTAAQHAQGTKLYTFMPGGAVRLAAIRLTVWRYRQKDANVFDKTTILATGVQITPSSIPPDIVDLLPPPRTPTYSTVL